MMKIYSIESKTLSKIARFAKHDFQQVVIDCPVCQSRKFRRIFPATLEYVSGEIEDFPGTGCILVARCEVAEDLANHFPGIEARPVKYHTGKAFWSSDEKPMLAKPYHGPELAEVYFPLRIPLNPEHSTLYDYEICPSCGFSTAGIEGVEEDPSPSRESGKGVFIPVSQLQGNMAFRFGGDHMMVLEPVKEYIEAQGYRNLQFFEYGEVIPDRTRSLKWPFKKKPWP